MKTVHELAEEVRAGKPLEIQLGDFLDEFYLAPDAARVGEDQRLRPIRRHLVVVDRQRLSRAPRREHRRIHQYLAPAGSSS